MIRAETKTKGTKTLAIFPTRSLFGLSFIEFYAFPAVCLVKSIFLN